MNVKTINEQQKRLQYTVRSLRIGMWFIFGAFCIVYIIARFMISAPADQDSNNRSYDYTYSYLKPAPDSALDPEDANLIGSKMLLTIDEEGHVIQQTPVSEEGGTAEPAPTPPMPVPAPSPDAVPGDQDAKPVPEQPKPDVYVPEHKEPVVFDGILNGVPLMIEKGEVKKDEVFWYFMKYLFESKDEDISRRVKPNFKNHEISYSACVENGEEFRGEYVHGKGFVMTYSPRRLDKNKYGLEDTWEGFITDMNRSGFYFCSLAPLPQYPVLKETEIEFEGIFVYLIKYEAEYGNKRVVPYVMVKSIRRVPPFVNKSGQQVSFILIAVACVFVIAIAFISWKYRKEDREFKEKMQAALKKRVPGLPKKNTAEKPDADTSPTEKIGPPEQGNNQQPGTKT